ncbi:probable serine/threonine-protein kinase samkC [Penaeus monodon]|uniref:probable serine/threonine-protein kinase samkC n=1 Tax=Penaeus monodon TaxID=6687 RepID=UPI0018A73BD4|nr:probable serine/threonine-protein kinase samkC [Penaeus monodon]
MALLRAPYYRYSNGLGPCMPVTSAAPTSERLLRPVCLVKQLDFSQPSLPLLPGASAPRPASLASCSAAASALTSSSSPSTALSSATLPCSLSSVASSSRSAALDQSAAASSSSQSPPVGPPASSSSTVPAPSVVPKGRSFQCVFHGFASLCSPAPEEDASTGRGTPPTPPLAPSPPCIKAEGSSPSCFPPGARAPPGAVGDLFPEPALVEPPQRPPPPHATSPPSDPWTLLKLQQQQRQCDPHHHHLQQSQQQREKRHAEPAQGPGLPGLVREREGVRGRRRPRLLRLQGRGRGGLIRPATITEVRASEARFDLPHSYTTLDLDRQAAIPVSQPHMPPTPTTFDSTSVAGGGSTPVGSITPMTPGPGPLVGTNGPLLPHGPFDSLKPPATSDYPTSTHNSFFMNKACGAEVKLNDTTPCSVACMPPAPPNTMYQR